MNELAKEIRDIIQPATALMADISIKNNCSKVGVDLDELSQEELKRLLPEIIKGVKFFSPSKEQAEKIIGKLKEIGTQ